MKHFETVREGATEDVSERPPRLRRRILMLKQIRFGRRHQFDDPRDMLERRVGGQKLPPGSGISVALFDERGGLAFR